MMDMIFERGVAQLRGLPYFPVIQSRTKYELTHLVLTVIGVGFEEVSKRVPELKGEVAAWSEGRRCAMGVLPKGPYITLEKRGDSIFYLGKGLKSPDVTFLFKNLDSAVLVLTAQMSAHQAMAECRILLDGQISYGMEMNRALGIVQTYLFPQFILDRIFKSRPRLTLYQLAIKGTVYTSLLPALVKNGLKCAFKASSGR